MKYFCCFLFLLFSVYSCSDNTDILSPEIGDELLEKRDEVVDLVNGVVDPLTSCDPAENSSELEVLDVFAQTRIIGLGEASHGTKEFFKMKHKLLKYYVEEHGYRGIIMEADFGECLKANEYILNDVGTIEDVLDAMHFWTWKTEEVKSMIQWMHDYNLGKLAEDKIHYLGSDCQFTDSNIEEIEKMITVLPEEIENAIKKYSNKIIKDIWVLRDYDVSELESNLLDTDSLVQTIQYYKAEIETATSMNEYQVLFRLATICHQVLNSRKNDLLDEPYNYRDLYMAENTVWWADHFGSDENFVVWAHNWHVSTVDFHTDYGGSQGAHLRSILDDDYQVIGFSMAMGEINAVDDDLGLIADSLPSVLKFASLSEIFYLNDNTNFIWVLDDEIKNDEDFKWFDNFRQFLMIGAVHPEENFYTSSNIFNEYDAIIHFDISTPSELID